MARAKQKPFISRLEARQDLLAAIIEQVELPPKKVEKILPAIIERIIITEAMQSKRLIALVAKILFARALSHLRQSKAPKKTLKELKLVVDGLQTIPSSAVIRINTDTIRELLLAAKSMNDKKLRAALGRNAKDFSQTIETAVREQADWIREN